MAINPEALYPGKIAPSTPDYPYGAARNITVPGDGSGTPWEAGLVNDLFGFQQALLGMAGIVPSGNPDKVGASQYLEALTKAFDRSFDSTAAMIADQKLTEGLYVRTRGYTAKGDGGAAAYTIVAAATGTADGVLFFDLSNGLQAQLDAKKEILVSQAGVTGAADDTVRYRAALAAAQTVGALVIDKDVRLETFDQTLSDGVDCASVITASVRIVYAGGELILNTAGSTNAALGVDTDANGSAISLEYLRSSGADNGRIYHSVAAAQLEGEEAINVRTSRHALFMLAEVTKVKRLVGNFVGYSVTAATNSAPTYQIQNGNKANALYAEEIFDIQNNICKIGNAVTNAMYFFGRIPSDSVVANNWAFNLAKNSTEGFDIDGVGARASVTNNHAIYCGYEYKQSTGSDYDTARDIGFTGNYSFEAQGTAFSFRSSGNFNNNVAYNPDGWAFFCSEFVADDLTSANGVELKGGGNVGIYAGAANFKGLKIGESGSGLAIGNINFDPFSIIVDPVYEKDNPGTKIPNSGVAALIDVEGDVRNVRVANGSLAPCTGDQVLILPGAEANDVFFERMNHGDCDGSCYDFRLTKNMHITNPVWPSSVGDRVARYVDCERVIIQAEEHPTLGTSAGSPTNKGVVINGLGYDATALAANPPTANAYWPQGTLCKVLADNEVWVRVTTSAAPASAWKKLS